MEHAHGSSRTDLGPNRQIGLRAAPGWILALALLGFGGGTPATAAQQTGAHGGSHHGYGMPEPVRVQVPDCPADASGEAGARMQVESGRMAVEAHASDMESECVASVPVSAMHALLPLQAGHYLRLCASHGHLCDLIAAHARIRTDARARSNQAPAAPVMQDTLAADDAALHAQLRTARTGRFESSWH